METEFLIKTRPVKNSLDGAFDTSFRCRPLIWRQAQEAPLMSFQNCKLLNERESQYPIKNWPIFVTKEEPQRLKVEVDTSTSYSSNPYLSSDTNRSSRGNPILIEPLDEIQALVGSKNIKPPDVSFISQQTCIKKPISIFASIHKRLRPKSVCVSSVHFFICIRPIFPNQRHNLSIYRCI